MRNDDHYHDMILICSPSSLFSLFTISESFEYGFLALTQSKFSRYVAIFSLFQIEDSFKDRTILGKDCR